MFAFLMQRPVVVDPPATTGPVCPNVDELSGAKCTLKDWHTCDHASVDQDFEIRWPRG